MNVMQYNIIIVSLLFIILAMTLLYLAYLFKYKKLKKEYYAYKRSVLKKCNRLNMIEYNMRRHKEKNENIYTTYRNLEEIVRIEETTI